MRARTAHLALSLLVGLSVGHRIGQGRAVAETDKALEVCSRASEELGVVRGALASTGATMDTLRSVAEWHRGHNRTNRRGAPQERMAVSE